MAKLTIPAIEIDGLTDAQKTEALAALAEKVKHDPASGVSVEQATADALLLIASRWIGEYAGKQAAAPRRKGWEDKGRDVIKGRQDAPGKAK